MTDSHPSPKANQGNIPASHEPTYAPEPPSSPSAGTPDAAPASIPFAVVPPEGPVDSGGAAGFGLIGTSRWVGIPAAQSPSSRTSTMTERVSDSLGHPAASQPAHSFAPSAAMWVLLAGLVLAGAAIGGIVTGLTGAKYTAVTLVQGAPARLDPGAFTQEDDRYVQTEAAYAGLNESVIGAALVDQLGQDDAAPASVTVVPGTTILRFVGSGDSAQEAADVANISAQTYVTAWRTRMSSALVESLTVIDTAAESAAEGAGQLAGQRATLDTQLEAVQSLQRIVQPASAQTSEPAANYAPGIVLGALVGGTFGLAVLLWQRRRILDQGVVA